MENAWENPLKTRQEALILPGGASERAGLGEL